MPDDDFFGSIGIKRVDPLVDRHVVKTLNGSASVFHQSELTDYGRQKQSHQPFWLFTPQTVSDAIKGLDTASSLGMNIRVRGAGHSMNGSTLPRFNELLLSTLGLKKLRRISNQIIEVGSGAQVWAVDQFLRQYDCSLPVVNDGGGPAPTVGGFFCAGGFGVNSREYGGFWNHVVSMQIWSREIGEQTINTDDELFWRLAASGNTTDIVILSARLKIRGILLNDIEGDINYNNYCHPRHLWFTFITTTGNSARLYRELARLHYDLKDFWSGLAPYAYHIKTLGRHRAHNFFPSTDSDLIAAGVWGSIEGVDRPNYSAIIDKVNVTSKKIPYSRRYWQSEL